MVEIRSKKTNKILLIGSIIKETKTTIKLNTSHRIYKKQKIIVQYVIAIIILSLSIACSTNKTLTKKQRLNALRITDSIANQAIEELIQETIQEHQKYHYE